MTERQTGLRFDIYERVHLADNTVGVKELDEVELVPHIQVYTEGDEAYLKGNLFLTGSYVGESGEEQRTLEHLIPVEITLPLNRIHDVSQVSVDIDNFDVDLLSARSLNVTGVLTLHGIEMLSAPDESWQEEEETVFVSRGSALVDSQEPSVETAAEAVAETMAEAEAEAEAEAVREEPAAQTAVQAEADAPAQESQAPAAEEISVRSEDPEEEDEGSAGVTEVYVEADDVDETKEPEAAEWQPNGGPELQPEPAPETVQATEEKKELKIAFGSKPAPDAPYHLKSLIHSGDTRSAAPAAKEEELAPTPRTDALEWKRLFSHGDEAEQTFSRMRLCIVQKEETLESIAQRYSINPREILLSNRLTEQDLTEGKVLYIPRK